MKPLYLAAMKRVVRLAVLPVLIAASLMPGLATSAAAAQAALGTSSPSTLREEDSRVGLVTYRLALAGRPQCSDPYPLTGLMYHHLAEYEAKDRPLMASRYRLDRGPGILAVLENTPAARAGLIAGDVLLTVNSIPFPSPVKIAAEASRKEWRKSVAATEMLIENQLRIGPVRLMVLREGREIPIVLGSTPGCPARVRLARSKQVNAFATDDAVIMTTALLDFVQSEDELSVILAHELSHVILRHPARLDEQGVPKKGIFRGIGKNASRVWKTEEEADRLAVKLVSLAGYDVGAMIPFWRRYYRKYANLPQIFRTHPSLRARERIAREAIGALSSPTDAPLPQS